MAEYIELSFVLPASAEDIYHAWIDSNQHSEMTGGAAEIEAHAGGKFSAWDGYIAGKTLTLEPFRRIVQEWRTSEFPEQSEDSLLEIILEEQDDQTRVTLIHSEIPDGQGPKYEDGWRKHYFAPMRTYFHRKSENRSK
jgi:activator of HSP90 ATPase